jgi:hypothetical protein
VADSIISGLTSKFSSDQAALADQVAKGAISPESFATATAAPVDEFKQGLSAGLGQLAVKGQVTDSIRQQFESTFSAAGASAGALFGTTARAAETLNV